MARQESVIQIKLTTAVIIVIALMSGAYMVLSMMTTLSTGLSQSVMGVHERVNNIKLAVDVQIHLMEETARNLNENIRKMEEVVGIVLETTDSQNELIQSTSEFQQQTITVLDGVNAFLAEHADTPEEVDATE